MVGIYLAGVWIDDSSEHLRINVNSEEWWHRQSQEFSRCGCKWRNVKSFQIEVDRNFTISVFLCIVSSSRTRTPFSIVYEIWKSRDTEFASTKCLELDGVYVGFCYWFFSDCSGRKLVCLINVVVIVVVVG